MNTFRYTPGTRVRVRRGPFPMDSGVEGRTGLVVETDEYRPRRYGVQLDKETWIRDLHEDELVPLTEEPKRASDLGSSGPSMR